MRRRKKTLLLLRKKEEEEKSELTHKGEAISPTEASIKKKGINWVPFKDIGPPPRQFSSRGRGSKRRNEGSRTFRGESRRGEFRRGGRGRNFPRGFSSAPLYATNYIPMMEGQTLIGAIQIQIEYYFSVDNLCKDLYLRGQMDSEGWVPLSLLAGFNKIKALTDDPNEIIESIGQSEIVEFMDGKLRRKNDWKVWLPPPAEKKQQEEKEEKKDVKEESLKQEVPQQKQGEDKLKQQPKKEAEPVKVVLAWGPEKKIITSVPQVKVEKKKKRNQLNTLQQQFNITTLKRRK